MVGTCFVYISKMSIFKQQKFRFLYSLETVLLGMNNAPGDRLNREKQEKQKLL